MTVTASPHLSVVEARDRVDELRSAREHALGALADAQHSAPAGVVGHVGLEDEVQRLSAELNMAIVALEALEHRERNLVAPSPAPADVDDQLAELEASYADASFARSLVGDEPEHDAEREEAERRLADIEGALDEYRRAQRRSAAAAAESERRERVALADQVEAKRAEARAAIEELVQSRILVADEVEANLARLVAAIEEWNTLRARLRTAATGAGATVPDGDARALSRHVRGLLAAAGLPDIPRHPGAEHLAPWGEQERHLLAGLLPEEA